MTLNLAIVAGLVAAIGILALAETAFMSARRSRLRKLAASGNARARSLLALAKSPSRFLGAVRFWILVAAVAAGASSAVLLARPLGAWLDATLGWTGRGQPIAVVFVAAAVTLAAFLFGEVSLKRIALGRPERSALLAIRLLGPLIRLALPLVNVLMAAADRLLARSGFSPPGEGQVSDEEVSILIERGLSQGVFIEAEKRMVEGVLALDRLSVMSIMTPRPKIVWLDLEDPEEVNWRKIVASGHSYFPVCEGSPDRVLGLLAVKALWANSAAGFATPMRDLLVKPLCVPESTTGAKLLESFKRTGRHVALVQDEFGTVSGIVTLIDVLEAIVGDLPARGRDAGPEARKAADGSWVIDATMPLVDLKGLLGVAELPEEHRADFQTLGGFVMTHFGRVPREGESFEAGGFHWEILSMERFRVDKVLVARVTASEDDAGAGDGPS